ILLAAYDSPKLLLSSIAFFKFNYYLKLLLITLPAIIITQRPGAAVAGAIFSVCAYDVYSGFAEVMHNSTPFLGSDYFYSLTIYSFIVVVFLSLIIYPLRRKKRKPVLTFNSQSANSLLINKNVK
ncbi:MAG TPA: hypothetical protein PLZ84_04115, partial [Clostridia bacterium]|nr:hypothetical protein [Clostridia bacterium]